MAENHSGGTTIDGITMLPAIDERYLEHDLIQQLVTEAVRAAMETPLREPILEAVAETTEGVVEDVGGRAIEDVGTETVEDVGEEAIEERITDEPTADADSRRLVKALQGLAVFVVLFVTLRRLLSRDD